MLSLAAAAALALYDSSKPKEGDVYYATVKNFHSVVLSQPGAVAVQFFDYSCSHCKALRPAWRSACKALRGRVRCAVVDGRSKLAKDYGVERFPTILYFAAEPGAGQATKRRPPLTYSGARDERSLIVGLNKLAAERSAAFPRRPCADCEGGVMLEEAARFWNPNVEESSTNVAKAKYAAERCFAQGREAGGCAAVYVVTNDNVFGNQNAWIEMAAESAYGLREHLSRVGVRIVLIVSAPEGTKFRKPRGDGSPGAPYDGGEPFDEVIAWSDPTVSSSVRTVYQGWLEKVLMLSSVEYERFVYIDGDTKVASGEVAYTFAALKRGDADLLAVREMEASNSRRALSPPGQHVDIFNTGLLGFRRTPAVRWRKFARDSAAIL